MKQQHIFLYLIRGLFPLLLCCASIQAQNDTIVEPAIDSTKIELKYGLRVGVDLGKIIRSSIDEDYQGIEFAGDYRLKEKLYIAGEFGIEEKNTITDYMDVTSEGLYLKAGIDYNMYDNWLDMDNMIFAGFRAGASVFSHDINEFTIYNTNQYWAPQFSSSDNEVFNDLTAFWAEIMLGIKVEIFKNFFMGFNAQLKFLVAETEPDNFENIYIPGFGKTYDSSGIGAGYSYIVSYRIPLYKKEKN